MTRYDEIVNGVAQAEKEECVLFKGSLGRGGYGQLKVNGKMIRANRLALELHLGRPLRNGMHALHLCRNKQCYNPFHLYEGTNAQNMHDKIKDGTNPVGETNPRAILTEEEVIEIRALIKGNANQTALARQYGVSRCTISDIKLGKSWTHV
jgi:hypothetical protein